MQVVKSSRIESIDILRGLVMVIMALDHVRDYFHINAFAGNYPENMESTNLILFSTRFITHFCAPTFVFLAGTSAFLFGQNKSKKTLASFLITRGLWLVFVEIIVVNFLWWFDITYSFLVLQVIWAIGVSMIILGGLIFIPKRILLILGLAIVLGHNLLDGITKEGQSLDAVLWYIIHQSNGIGLGEEHSLVFAYPVLPWIGVMILGYCLGELFIKETPSHYRKRWLRIVGLSSIALFFILRAINIYGDLNPWEFQETTEKTIISFFNVTKYPPSLDYLLITLGPALLFLNYIESVKNKFSDFLLVFGRVPFFYYLLHILLIHVAAIIGLIISGNDWQTMILSSNVFESGDLHGYGYPLAIVYLLWILIVLLLYPLCNKYMIYKANNRDKWWLSYL